MSALVRAVCGRGARRSDVAGGSLTRFQKLAAATVATTFILVVIGVVVRATDAGLGCPDWPLCHGQLLPSIGDSKGWIEWTHRGVAALIGILVLAMAAMAALRYRDRG